ncbi:hypothetical protein [Thermovenabulum gondwanense]|uniref:Uncharacterized protein n=1 Tax=Thermovenabulum gondwanense TaxID=520767 RepID=A0A162MDK3_9FIRM|nr:hypothetical protein [Thermovenabulum gondwanense]KYO65382.1 hypothetical protein ATZ99_16160 [Thermovenabulum gondwanense]
MKISDQMIAVLSIASLLIIIALFTNNAYLFLFSFPFFVFSWVFLGVIRNQNYVGAGYKSAIIITLLIWLMGFYSMNNINTKVVPETFILGFPLATAIMVYFVWALPVLTFTIPYGLFFERDCISESELKELLSKIKEM